MGTFRHHIEGRIWINGIMFTLEEFLIEEPGYVLPKNGIGREYDGVRDILYTDAGQFAGEQESILEGYIAKLSTYQSNKVKRDNDASDVDYSPTLTDAKARCKQLIKTQMVSRFNTYRDSDLEISNASLQTYKTDLIAQKTTIATEIDALTTIAQVRQYQYSAWPATP